jgi:hypothetical protein
MISIAEPVATTAAGATSVDAGEIDFNIGLFWIMAKGDGKAEQPEAHVAPLLKVRRTAQVMTSMMDPKAGRIFHMFHCQCGDKSWTSEKA